MRHPVLVIALKDLKLLLRHRVDAFFVFVFPIVFAGFFTQVISGSVSGKNRIRLAAVDEDRGPEARDFLARLEADPGLRVERMSRAKAEASVRRGRRPVFVILEAGFARNQNRPPRLLLGVDPARAGEAALVKGSLLRIGGDLVEARLAKVAPRMARPLPHLRPLTVVHQDVAGPTARPPAPAAVTLPQGMVWGLLACAAAFGASLVSERSRGTLLRLRASPLRGWHILAGKGLACFLTVLSVSGLLLALSGPAFGVTPDSWGLLALAVLSAGVCFVGLMMLIGLFGRNEDATNRIGWAFILVLAMLGGAMVPSYVMPEWMDQLGYISPVKWTILALEGAIWRGFDLREQLVPCGVLAGTGVVTFALGAFLFRWR